MDRAFYGLSINDIRTIVYDYCQKNNIKNNFNSDTKMAGRDFVAGFLKRHPKLSHRRPESVSVNRVFGLNKTSVNLYFDNLKTLLNKHNFKPHEISNCDESGLTCVHKPVKVIAPKGKRCVSSVTSGERGQTTTVLVSCSASGIYIPPMMIFSTIEYAHDNGVVMLSLPPHTSHKLQPLDRSVFKPLKSAFNAACSTWLRNHPGRRISVDKLGELFNAAYLKAATIENAVSGFRCTGIVPFNEEI